MMHAGAGDSIGLDLIHIRKQHRVRRWRELLDGFFCQSEYNIPEAFQNGRMQGSCVDGIGIGRFRSDPISGMRTKSLLARNPVDAFLVVIADDCPIIMTQGGRVVRLNQRSFTLVSTSEPVSFHQLAAGSHQGLIIPGDLLRKSTSRIQDRLATSFGHEPLHAMFHTLAAEWSLNAHAMSPGSRTLVAKSIIELLGLAIDGADDRSAESVVQSGHRRRIELIIQESYANPALDPVLIARRMGLSPRRIQSILAGQGTTVSRLTRERRVAEALRLCRFGDSPQRSPQSVAQEVGYADVQQFYRDMEEIGGHRPTQLEK